MMKPDSVWFHSEIKKVIFWHADDAEVNCSTPMSDWDKIIYPYNIKQTSDESKEKCQLGDY